MSTKKPSALAVLKNLSPERQAEVWSRMTAKTATWKDTSYAAVRKWLAQDGIETSHASLSDFYSWYPLQQQYRADEVTTDSLLEQLKAEVPGLTEEQLDELGQRTFSLLAIRNQDLSGFVTVRSAMTKAQLEKAKLKLREQAEKRMEKKLEFDKERFKEGLRTKLESGLAELATHIKGNPAAQTAYAAFKATIKETTE
ncbi:MAG TPA: hypothetical protein VG347_05000 [Verrucomicrobiae bacterium]|nr:hypothetical protein [Verrucomicrobiae bacterium]